MIKKEINIIGGGCAALSLARLIRNLPNIKFNLFIGNKNKTNKDHLEATSGSYPVNLI